MIRKDVTCEVLMYKSKWFISVVSAQSDLSPHLLSCLIFSSAFLYLFILYPQKGFGSDTEHKLHCLPVCVMNGSVEGRGGEDWEVEEEKVTVFPESKPPVFDHGQSPC